MIVTKVHPMEKFIRGEVWRRERTSHMSISGRALQAEGHPHQGLWGAWPGPFEEQFGGH